jgi:hypothetical protein
VNASICCLEKSWNASRFGAVVIFNPHVRRYMDSG